MLLFVACELEKPVDLDIAYTKDRLVVYGLLDSKGVFVQLSHTVHPLQPKDENSVQNATVELFAQNTKLFNLISINESQYISPNDFFPQQNTEYHIVVTANGFETAVSEKQKLPFKVKIDSLGTIQKFGTGLYYKFTDPLLENNYYRDDYNVFFGSKNENNYSRFPSDLGIFSDIDFNGKSTQQKWESIHFSDYKIENNQLIEIPADSVRVRLFSISKDLYLHLKTLFDYEGSNADPYIDQPPIVYTNIKNGFGIFGSFAVDSLTVTIPDNQ